MTSEEAGAAAAAAAPAESSEAPPGHPTQQADGSGSSGMAGSARTPNPGMQLYTATETTEEGVKGSLQMIVGDGCCFMWIGPAAASSSPLGSLCVATMTKYDALPVSSVLLRDAAEDDLAQSLAHRLAKKTGRQVFASCSLEPGNPQQLPLLAALERRALGMLTESSN